MREESFSVCLMAAARVGIAENVILYFCFTLANGILNKFITNEPNLPIANFQTNAHGVCALPEFGPQTSLKYHLKQIPIGQSE